MKTARILPVISAGRLARVFTVLAAMIASLAVAAGPAHAEPGAPVQPLGCPYEEVVSTPSIIVSSYHLPVGIDFKSGPGGTVSGGIQYSLAVGVTVSASVSFSASAIVASANATLGISTTVTATIGQTWGYSHDVTPGKYGHLRFGSWGWRINIKKEVWNTGCNYLVYTGSANVPNPGSWGYYFWETSS